MRILLTLLFAICLTTTTSAQVNLYVDSAQTSSGTGTTWATAYKTLNEALNVANGASTASGYTIRVAKGTYYPGGAQSDTTRDSTFAILRGGLRLYGGYSSGGGTRNVAAFPTILSGAVGTAQNSTDNSYHVMVITNIAANADSVIIDGLSVTEGTTDTALSTKTIGGVAIQRQNGGGIYAKNVPAKLLFQNCRFFNNRAFYFGGGLFCQNANYDLRNCTFSNNKNNGISGVSNSGGGGGTWNSSGVTRVYGCTFVGNQAIYAGGMGSEFTALTIDSSFFNSNVAIDSISTNAIVNGGDGNGGGLMSQAGTTTGTFTRCTFSNNRASKSGGAAYMAASSASIGIQDFSDCTFTGNTVVAIKDYKYPQSGAINSTSAILNISSSSFTGNSVKTSALAAAGGFYGRGGAISNDLKTLTINNCTFTNDTAGFGAAIYASTYLGPALIATNCTFTNNYAPRFGGAIFSLLDPVTLNNCAFTGNQSEEHGGALVIPTGTVNNCRFKGNMSGTYGGACVTGSTTTNTNFFSCLFSGNKAGTTGGAVSTNRAAFDNCTFAGDTASTGNAISSGGNTFLSNCIIWEGVGSSRFAGNTVPSITYSTVQGSYTGTGNTALDPLFTAPSAASAAPTTGGDYTLQPCSPAVNAGSPGLYSGLLDIAGNPRLVAGIVDQGAYELQAPPAGILTGSSDVCVGSSIQFTPGVPGGTWSVGSITAASVNSTGLVTGVSAPGISSIIYTVATTPAGCGGKAVQSVTVTAVPVVGAITGPASVCVGNTIQLGNINSGGTWLVSNPSIASLSASGSLTGLLPGTTTVRYKRVSANGLCADSALKTITVNAKSATNIAGQFCRGIPYTFNGQALTAPGVYTVQLANANGCDSIVTLNLTNATPDTTVINTSSVLTAAPVQGATYQWLKCEPNGSQTLQLGATAQSFIPPATGQYAVTITANGCTATSGCHLGIPVGVNTVSIEDIAVFPNPTKGLVTISTGQFRIQSIRVSDMTGRVLRVLDPIPSATTTVDLSGLPAGHYLLHVVTSGGDGTRTVPITIAGE